MTLKFKFIHCWITSVISVKMFLADCTQKIMQACMRLYADVYIMAADVCRMSAASAQFESLLKFL